MLNQVSKSPSVDLSGNQIIAHKPQESSQDETTIRYHISVMDITQMSVTKCHRWSSFPSSCCIAMDEVLAFRRAICRQPAKPLCSGARKCCARPSSRDLPKVTCWVSYRVLWCNLTYSMWSAGPSVSQPLGLGDHKQQTPIEKGHPDHVSYSHWSEVQW